MNIITPTIVVDKNALQQLFRFLKNEKNAYLLFRYCLSCNEFHSNDYTIDKFFNTVSNPKLFPDVIFDMPFNWSPDQTAPNADSYWGDISKKWKEYLKQS